MDLVEENGMLLAVTENGYGKRTDVAEYRHQTRGGTGVINVRVRGTSTSLGRLTTGDVKAVLDVATARPGRNLFHIGPDLVSAPFGVEVSYAGPATVALQFERQLTKTVPVKPDVEGDAAIVPPDQQVAVVGDADRIPSGRELLRARQHPLRRGGGTVAGCSRRGHGGGQGEPNRQGPQAVSYAVQHCTSPPAPHAARAMRGMMCRHESSRRRVP
jgi:hypothetical protein